MPVFLQRLKYTFFALVILLSSTPFAEEKWQVPDGFPDDFQAPIDSGGLGKGVALQGFGGKGQAERNPVIFIHGNGADANMFREFARIFHYRFGYRDSELWAFSFQGHPNKKRLENKRNKLPHPHQYAVDDVHQMVERVLNYTGKKKVTLFAYSLGVTVARHYLKKHNAYDKVDTFVSIVGANHGFVGANAAGETEWTPEGINELCLHESGDETPFGKGKDSGPSIAPDDTRQINWLVFHGGKDDWILNLNLRTFRQVDNSQTGALDGADLLLNFEGKLKNLRKPYGAHASIYLQPTLIFDAIAPYFEPKPI